MTRVEVKKLAKNDLIRVTLHDWEAGEQAFDARFAGLVGAAHVRIRRDDGLVFAVPVSAISHVDAPAGADAA